MDPADQGSENRHAQPAVPTPSPSRIRLVVTDRQGGCGRAPFDTNNISLLVGDDEEVVQRNRTALAQRVGVPVERLVFMDQVHGRDVALVQLSRTGRVLPDTPAQVDALVTCERGVALAAVAADCVPIGFADPRRGVIGVAHAGRRGVELGVVPAAIEAMQRLGADPADIVAWLGPAVCGSCYEVPADLQAQVIAVVPETACATRAGTPGLELRAGVVAQLEAVGVRDVRIDARCTMESAELFSHRRDAGVTGRQGVVIALEPAS